MADHPPEQFEVIPDSDFIGAVQVWVRVYRPSTGSFLVTQLRVPKEDVDRNGKLTIDYIEYVANGLFDKHRLPGFYFDCQVPYGPDQERTP